MTLNVRVDLTVPYSRKEEAKALGLVIARRIIEGRPYRTVDDLRRVKGIGEKRMGQDRSLVRVR